MKIPAALNPANHLHVQCLLLHAGLCADDSLASQHGRLGVYKLAHSLALSRAALEESSLESRRPPRKTASPQDLHKHHQKQQKVKPAERVRWRSIAQLLSRLVGTLPSLPAPHASESDQKNKTPLLQQQLPLSPSLSEINVRGVAFTPPSRLLPLYAPRTLLPPIPLYPFHDDVTYDAAVQHAALLSKLLAPYGFEVALTGPMRRGCPVGTHADYLISLTEDATREMEAVQEMRDVDAISLSQLHKKGEVGNAERSQGRNEEERTNPLPGNRRASSNLSTASTASRRSAAAACKVTGTLHRDALTIPMEPPPAPECAFSCFPTDDTKSSTDVDGDWRAVPRRQQPPLNGYDKRRRQYTSRVRAFAAADAVSPQVAYRTKRAVEELIRCGYIVAGHLPYLSPSFLSRRQPIIVSVRYDTRCPAQVPPVECADPTVLARLKLHRVHLFVCPWQARATRLFFLTGPPAFTAHATLQALAHGVDLNMNGAFECKAVALHADPGVDDAPVGTRSETDASRKSDWSASEGIVERQTTTAQSTSRQQHQGDVVQVVLEEEANIFEMAGLPPVDPLLRGAYSQLHYLEEQ